MEYNYRHLAMIFQDRYTASAKSAGLPVYTLHTEEILEYLYRAELEILHSLAKAKDLESLKGFVALVEVASENLNPGPVSNSKKTPKIKFDYYVKSDSEIISTHYETLTDYIGNEIIRPEQAPLFYKSVFNSPYFKNPKIYIEDNFLDAEGNTRIFDFTFEQAFE